MKVLILLASLFLSTSVAGGSVGYPVTQMLRQNTFLVDHGTGFQVNYKGRLFLVTNWHVCRHFKSVLVSNETMQIQGVSDIIKINPTKDLCVMTPISDYGLKIGFPQPDHFPVYTMGYPQNEDASNRVLTFRSGYTINNYDTTLEIRGNKCLPGFKTEVVQERGKEVIVCKRKFYLKNTTIQINPGASGSAVVNSKGKLVGVVNSMALDGSHLMSYVELKDLVQMLDSL